MAGYRKPGPVCATVDGIDNGTLALRASPIPGPVCSSRLEDVIAELIALGTYSTPTPPTHRLAKRHRGKRLAKHHRGKTEATFKCPRAGKLGALSAHYESGNTGSAAIGYDSTGGWSYGKYQIETKGGTMKGFLSFATTKSPETSKALDAAGGYDAALRGDQKFKNEWVTLAKNASFETLQHDFVASKNYEPLVTKVKADTGLDVDTRSAALRDVVWSVAVQHGPKTSLIGHALAHKRAATMSDEAIIDAIYDERSATREGASGGRVLKYFSNSTKEVQKDVARRYVQERFCAKQMLDLERGTTGKSP